MFNYILSLFSCHFLGNNNKFQINYTTKNFLLYIKLDKNKKIREFTFLQILFNIIFITINCIVIINFKNPFRFINFIYLTPTL